MTPGRAFGVVTGSALALAMVVGAVGCAGDGGSDSGSADGAAAGDGAALYEASCASCHGSDLRGTDEGPSHLSIVYEPGHHSDDSFRSAVAQGVRAHHWDFGDMPPVEGLSDAEVDAIIAFVRAQQDEHGFEDYPPG